MEQITNLFTNQTFLTNIPMVVILIVVVVFLAKMLKVKIRTEHITIGGESADRWNERKIIQEQTDFAHEFLMGLMNKVKATCTDELQYGGWFAKCILEDIYDEILCWITFNHITEDEAYISTKQVKICTMVYTYDVRPEFKTPEFQDRMKQWVTEMIHELVRIRKVYTKQSQGR